jgi:hypothetical protein
LKGNEAVTAGPVSGNCSENAGFRWGNQRGHQEERITKLEELTCSNAVEGRSAAVANAPFPWMGDGLTANLDASGVPATMEARALESAGSKIPTTFSASGQGRARRRPDLQQRSSRVEAR